MDKTSIYIKEGNEYKEITDRGSLSDGYHTFDELYEHRMHLFATICNQNPHAARKSKLHAVGEIDMYKDYFIIAIATNEGWYSYHYHMDYWDMFDVEEVERGPKWDGHQPSDITRLHSGFIDYDLLHSGVQLSLEI